MLNRILVLVSLLAVVSSLKEASAEVMQVNFTAELIEGDTGPIHTDAVVEGFYQFDSEATGRETNSLGIELVYSELQRFLIQFSNQTYAFDEGLVYYTQPTESISEASPGGESIEMLSGVSVGEIIYPEEHEFFENYELPLLTGDLSKLSANYNTVPYVLSPGFEIGLTSVLSVIDSEESSAPVPTGDATAARLTIHYAVPLAAGGTSVPQVFSAAYEITSLVTVVLVPEPSTLAMFILGFLQLAQRRTKRLISN